MWIGVHACVRACASFLFLKVECPAGTTVLPSDVLIFKMSYHPLWRSWACGGGGGGRGVGRGGGGREGMEARCREVKLFHAGTKRSGGGGCGGRRARKKPLH